MLVLLIKKSAKKLVMVMIPSPPTWMSMMMTICPKLVNVLGTSIVVSPVTQTALVAVNSESIQERCTPGWMQRGISNKPEPARMMNMKLTAIARAGFVFLPMEVMTVLESSMKAIRKSISK